MPRKVSSQLQVGCTACQSRAIETAIWRKARSFAESALRKSPSRAFELYGELPHKKFTILPGPGGIPAETVAEVVHKVLAVKRSKACCLAGRDATIRRRVERFPTSLRLRLTLKQILKYGTDSAHAEPASHRAEHDER